MIKVILVDDINAHLNRLKKALVIYSSDIEIIGAYTNHKEAVAQIVHLKPDVLFLDVKIPGTSGFKLADSVKHICSNVIYISDFPKYGPDTYVDNAISFITKGKLNDPKFLMHAIAKLKATIEQQRSKQAIILPSVPGSYSLKQLTLKDGHRISISLKESEKDYNLDVLLSVESYRTLSKFIAHKYIGSVIKQEAAFLINHNNNPVIFRNLSQAKIRFMKDINEQLKNIQIELSPESFFENTIAGGYALNIHAKAISFSFKALNLKLWADIYIKEVIRNRHLAIIYQVEGNQIIIT